MPTDTPPINESAGSSANSMRSDDIVSVNDRGRRSGNRLGSFLMIGAIFAVVLVGGLVTVNMVRAKFAGKNTPPQSGPAAARLNFSAQAAPEVPGPEAGSSQPAQAQALCGDGSVGNPLKDPHGVAVVNAMGRSLRVCPNGQVLADAGQTNGAPPIPLASSGSDSPSQRTQTYSAPAHAQYVNTAQGYMMLNDGKYTEAQNRLDLSDSSAVLGLMEKQAQSSPPRSEGLLTTATPSSLEAELIPTRTPLIQAGRIGDMNLLLPKGRTIDCTMSMRVISSLAGQASCVVTSNVYSANGKVVLIERGSEAVGEYRSGASIGQKRVFILWTRILTPSGVVINLDSPGADPLGSTGLTGEVDTHWFERIGSAFMLSVIQDTLQYEVAQAQSRAGGATLVLSNTSQAGSAMADRILQQSINIPPTIYKNQGDRANIYVARDLDFSSVYRLRVAR